VVLVGHSWGGVVISQAGVNDKVKALVYVAAFAPPKGLSIKDLGKGQPAAPWLSQLQPRTTDVSARYVVMLSQPDAVAAVILDGATYK
jgi:pimeloyl-ACP methyl ester carboxylesterase